MKKFVEIIFFGMSSEKIFLQCSIQIVIIRNVDFFRPIHTLANLLVKKFFSADSFCGRKFNGRVKSWQLFQ